MFRTIALLILFNFSESFEVKAHKSLDDAILFEELSKSYENLPSEELFQKSLLGYHKLQNAGHLDKQVLTIIDFSRSANEKRMWIIDLAAKKLLFHSLVAHGKNTGQEYATSFSNKPQSLKSSLGFYVTGATYYGKHGLSLNLIGMEKGINDNAKTRRIVMHGAAYVSKTFIAKHGRLGRSFGCPAVPKKDNQQIIDSIKGKSCLFIYFPDDNYLNNSLYLN